MMAVYFNPGNKAFRMLRSSDYFVDRSLIISDVMKTIRKNNRYLCVSRPSHFGKTCDANMLVAYYSKGCDSSCLFDNLHIAHTKDYRKYLNQSNVIFINMKDVFRLGFRVKETLSNLTQAIIEEIRQQYKELNMNHSDLGDFLEEFYYLKDEQFIFIIDEWDALLRDERKDDKEIEAYLSFLSALFKGRYYVQFVYMTGILPIRKSGDESDLDMFEEITMIHSHLFSHFMGFTEDEVKTLCLEKGIAYQTLKQWYGGYLLDNKVRIYCPYMIVKTLYYKKYYGYWNKIENYLILKKYLSLDYHDIEGIQGDIIKLLIGQKVHISPYYFKNDMLHLSSNNDVLTLLVHLGYLTINIYNEVSIPCFDLYQLFKNVVSHLNWNETRHAFKNSSCLYERTLNKDGKRVGELIEEIHHDLSKLSYWDDDCLLYSLELAYLDYTYYHTRKILLSRPGCKVLFYPSVRDKPSLLFELNWEDQPYKEDDYLADLKDDDHPLLFITLHYKEMPGYHYRLESCSTISL